MTENKAEKQEEKWIEKYAWMICVLVLIAFLGLLTWSSTMKDIAEKNYMASLSPGERLEMAEQEELARIQQEQLADEYWDGFFDGMLSTMIWSMKYPFNPFVVMIFVLFVWLLIEKSRWLI